MSRRLTLTGSLARSDGFRASFELDTELEGVTAILGPSGAGKSTLLRMIAGLEPSAEQQLTVADETWDDATTRLPPHLRAVGIVFQDGRLFPHLTVADNLRFPLRLRSRAGFRLAFDDVVAQLALHDLLGRQPHSLSGGQRQRVALGRALLTPARLWLFDEPLAALDTAAKQEIAPYLQHICREHRVPIFYVTHSLEEIVAVADTLLIVDAGTIVANQTIEAQSRLLPIDETSRGGSVLHCRVASYDALYDLTQLRIGDHPMYLRGRVAAGYRDVRVLVPARDVSIATDVPMGLSVLNRLPCRIDAIGDDGASCNVTLDCEGQRVLARITRYSRDELGLAVGQRVIALIKTAALATLHA
jgi:molybdate transport system ATP-binding protein